ncbi:hypothetical protein CH063_07169 [Colletotrichum higginsianum]|uniref:C6 zinc finger domain containing protein n=1 Tax=Colletotrichum higginsianum (strain IMI 349063) TaxID=759273 RepID=H1V563_COLHI|nr:C6 zinc finger domain containing protein [Colletotrichum higginsianum IMI 349063]OBR10759.1 C6 zinc finger domain containing protein [Colletotrichum higginsianum IMI 349063]CCF35365.1 hypothetical protein CH063_07169 [Colletotrichum higginsianum]
MSILPGTTTQPWTSFDITANCSLTGNYFAWVVTQDNEPPFPEVAKFWRMTVGLEGAQNLSDAVVIEWHEWARSNGSDLVYQVNILDACRDELCRSIGSEIDGGLAGFGVLASYGLGAVFLTLYGGFALRGFFKRRKTTTALSEKPHTAPPDGTPGFLGRIDEALRCTTYDLFTAAAFLSLGVQATVIYSQVAPATHHYNSSLQLIVSALAFYPLAAMLPLVLASGRRSLLKGAILVSLFVVHTGAWVLCTNGAQDNYYHNETPMQLCPQNHPPQAVVSAAMFTMAAMVWMPPLFGICLSVVLCFYRCNSRVMWQAKWLDKVAQGAVVLYAAANFICMWGAWTALVVFIKGAPRRAEDVWNLGQALALTPWIPVLVEFASILCGKSYIPGTEAGLAGRLPLGFDVVRQEKVLHQQEDTAFLDDSPVH